MEKFDVIVVGAGPAGSTAAHVAAKAGAQVLLLERGPEAGSKTVSGGLLYTHVLRELFPKFWEEEDSPFERWICRYVVGFLTPTRYTCLDFFDSSFGQPPFNTVSVLRSRLDKWLTSKAQEAGAVFAAGVKVDDLIKENGKVTGIKAGSDEIHADVVIVCDGVNSLLAKSLGVRSEWNGSQLGIGVKQVFEIPRKTLETRFGLTDRSGVEYTFLGLPNKVEGGGFLYTNKDSVSLGLILNMESVVKQKLECSEVVEDFRSHPLISRLISDGTLLEYSTCLVAEGGFNMIPQLYGAGFLVAGSAAALVLNTGFNLRGMDFAIGSGKIAGEVAAFAVKEKDCSASYLSKYKQRVMQSFVLRDLKRYKNYPSFFKKPRLYFEYPELINEFLHNAYFVNGEDKGHLYGLFRQSAKHKLSTLSVLRDLWEASRTL
jgi:electron transfer flavoprotein-quinone oxidoreductase